MKIFSYIFILIVLAPTVIRVLDWDDNCEPRDFFMLKYRNSSNEHVSRKTNFT